MDKTLERIEAKIDNLDKKFAARWVQTVVGAMVGAILLGFLGVAITFFIPQKTPVTQTPTTPITVVSPTGTGTPTASANSSATATPANPTATDSQSSGGGVTVPLPLVSN